MERFGAENNYQWHVALNAYNSDPKEHRSWMYEAKQLADEVGRLEILFEQERTGTLRKVHRQCSHQDPEPVDDNHLTCCLGVECRKCPHLLALDKAKVEPYHLDGMKAWTCAAHILTESAQRMIDTSEGYILTVDDRMFWDNVYSNLASNPDEEGTEDG